MFSWFPSYVVFLAAFKISPLADRIILSKNLRTVLDVELSFGSPFKHPAHRDFSCPSTSHQLLYLPPKYILSGRHSFPICSTTQQQRSLSCRTKKSSSDLWYVIALNCVNKCIHQPNRMYVKEVSSMRAFAKVVCRNVALPSSRANCVSLLYRKKVFTSAAASGFSTLPAPIYIYSYICIILKSLSFGCRVAQITPGYTYILYRCKQ